MVSAPRSSADVAELRPNRMRRAAGRCGPIRIGFPRTSEVGDVSWTIPTIAVIVLGFAAVSRLLDGTVITAPMVFAGAGLVLGARALGVVDPAPTGTTVKL